MPTCNVNLTDELDTFVLAKVESRRYENASEVVRTALRTLEREERHYEAKIAVLRMAIDEGDHSGVAEGNSFDRVRPTLRLPGKRRVPRRRTGLTVGRLPFIPPCRVRPDRTSPATPFVLGVKTRRCVTLTTSKLAAGGRPNPRPAVSAMEQGRHVVFFRRASSRTSPSIMSAPRRSARLRAHQGPTEWLSPVCRGPSASGSARCTENKNFHV